MAEEQVPQTVNRIYEQPPDAVSFYSDQAQVIGAGPEIMLQFYETIPGPPGPDGKIQHVRTLLRATITVGMVHARSIGQIILKRAEEAAQAPVEAAPEAPATAEEAPEEESE